MNKVSSLSRLGDDLHDFTGATIDEAIKSDEEWAARNNRQLRGNYYLRIRIGKSESICCDLEPIFSPDSNV